MSSQPKAQSRASYLAPPAWSSGVSKYTVATLLFVWISCVHLSSLYLFTRGFLLSRQSLDTINTCSPNIDLDCSLPATHKKAIFLIIDSLRFDFISPHPPTALDANHHHVLTLPAELTLAQPSNSFIFNSYSDPPTATLQRIKGITTGSLPTFIDIGSSFGGSAVTEDSLIHQLRLAGKKVAFMGDDTWNVVYPGAFEQNLTFPFDSFNVEDLHTVDEGVIRHLFPLLPGENEETSSEHKWDFIIGHFLGVDHVGHRVGPGHSTMKAKLKQMDTTLRKVVDLMDSDTLLVVLGDHGMDRKGDHGGDGELETQSAMWLYSKKPLMSPQAADLMSRLDLPKVVFPGSAVPHRSIQQIDIVPTISLLLGLPIPFNNLGAIIPEVFWRITVNPLGTFDNRSKSAMGFPDLLLKAMKINALQVQKYLEGYRSSSSGGELEGVWGSLGKSWKMATEGVQNSEDRFNELLGFVRLALNECRSLWARFNIVLMYTGLASLGLSVIVAIVGYRSISKAREMWHPVAVGMVHHGAIGALAGLAVGSLLKVALDLTPAFEGTFSSLQGLAVGASFGSQLAVLASIRGLMPAVALGRAVPKPSFYQTYLPIGIILLHAISYTSNSFLMWEDRILQYLFMALLVPTLLISASSPTYHLRVRILKFAILTGALLRFISLSTVCREEQHPFCHVTFYASATLPTAPMVTLVLAPILAFYTPDILIRFLAISSSDKGVAPFFLLRVSRVLLLGGSAYWLLERLEMWDGLNQDRVPFVQALRTILARLVMGSTVIGGGVFWWYSPLCVELKEEKPTGDGKKRVVILGFANAYGASYLLFFATVFTLIFSVTQPSGQCVLALSVVAMLSYVEVSDSERDSAGMIEAFKAVDPTTATDASLPVVSQRPTISMPVFIVLLSLLLFYTTGHQAVLSTIQWKSAFIGFPVLTYPFSPLLVVLNTFGPLLLPILATPLFALWNVSPTVPAAVGGASGAPQGPTQDMILGDSIKLCLGVVLYHSGLTFGTATSAAILRRHLMVWKVFAPRYMMGAVSLLVVDIGVILAIGVGVRRVMWKVGKTFGL